MSLAISSTTTESTTYEHGTRNAVIYLQEKNVYAMDGTPVFWIGEDADDVHLHPYDVTQPLRFYFDLFDKKPGETDLKTEEPKLEDQARPEDAKLGGVKLAELKPEDLRPGDLTMLVKKLGRRAVFEILQRDK